jgi:hypothetical protein
MRFAAGEVVDPVGASGWIAKSMNARKSDISRKSREVSEQKQFWPAFRRL